MEHRQNSFTPAPSSTDAGAPLNIEAQREAPPDGSRDILSFDPVPLRHRVDGLTPQRQREYVEALADTGVARQAAARVGLTEQSIARIRRRSDARAFDLACEAAHRLGARRLRSIAYERAIEGVVKCHYYRGELVGEERVFDNRLLIHLLARTEHLLDEPKESRAIAENWEPCMEALEQARPLPLPEPEPDSARAPAGDEFDEDEEDAPVWKADGVWWTHYPPPQGFDGEEEEMLGDADYQRTLTDEEEAAMRARRVAEDEAELARCCAVRDRFFGLPNRGSTGLPPPVEAEPYEPSGASAVSAAGSPYEPEPEWGNRAGQSSSEGGSG